MGQKYDLKLCQQYSIRCSKLCPYPKSIIFRIIIINIFQTLEHIEHELLESRMQYSTNLHSLTSDDPLITPILKSGKRRSVHCLVVHLKMQQTNTLPLLARSCSVMSRGSAIPLFPMEIASSGVCQKLFVVLKSIITKYVVRCAATCYTMGRIL